MGWQDVRLLRNMAFYQKYIALITNGYWLMIKFRCVLSQVEHVLHDDNAEFTYQQWSDILLQNNEVEEFVIFKQTLVALSMR